MGGGEGAEGRGDGAGRREGEGGKGIVPGIELQSLFLPVTVFVGCS